MSAFARVIVVLCACCILASCDDYRPSLSADSWKETKSGIYDGAVRIAAYTYKSDRELEVRCFAHRADSERRLDIRYTVWMRPEVRGLDKAFKGIDGITLNVSVDDDPAVPVGVRAGFGRTGDPWFLGEIDTKLAAKIRDAKAKIVAVPMLNREELDTALAFSVKDVGQQISRVIEACSKPAPQASQ